MKFSKFITAFLIFTTAAIGGTAFADDSASGIGVTSGAVVKAPATESFGASFGSQSNSACSFLYSPIFPTGNCLGFNDIKYDFLAPQNASSAFAGNPFGTFIPATPVVIKPAEKQSPPKKKDNREAAPVSVVNASQQVSPVRFVETAPAQPAPVPVPAADSQTSAPAVNTQVPATGGGRTTDGPSIHLEKSAVGSGSVTNAFGGGSTSRGTADGTNSAPLNQNTSGSVSRAFGGSSTIQQGTSNAVSSQAAPGSGSVMRAFGGAPPVPQPSTAGVPLRVTPGSSDVMRSFGGPPPRVPVPVSSAPIPIKNSDYPGKVPSTAVTDTSVVQPAPPLLGLPMAPVSDDENVFGPHAVKGGPVESHNLDLGQVKPLTPVLPTDQNRQALQAVCPDCLNAAYSEVFNSFKDIVEHTPGVDHALKVSGHNLMKIVHLRCDADQVFVPTDYVTNLKYSV